jgi:hypothetical protein
MSGRVNHPGQFSARTTLLFWSVFNERQQLARFEFIEEAMNTDLLIGFMERLISDSSQKVFLILDNLKEPWCTITHSLYNRGLSSRFSA